MYKKTDMFSMPMQNKKVEQIDNNPLCIVTKKQMVSTQFGVFVYMEWEDMGEGVPIYDPLSDSPQNYTDDDEPDGDYNDIECEEDLEDEED